MTPPSFWSQPSFVEKLLAPLGWIYGAIVTFRRRWTKSTKVDVPVICVGNLTMGGSGKTPTVIALVELVRSWGYTPHILSRGYGGSLSKNTEESVLVDPTHHIAAEVGDEPLLLSQHAPTWVHRDRVLSAQKAIEAGATLLIMDDGLQNPGLYQDLKIAVFDGQSGIGNGQIFPAGPLRESLERGLKRIDICLLLHFKEIPSWLASQSFQGKIMHGYFETSVEPLKSKRYIAFAGIGYPQKFFQTLEEKGFSLIDKISFPDHHFYTDQDIEKLRSIKDRYEKELGLSEEIMLVTTEKDAVKLSKDFRELITVLPVKLNIQDSQGIRECLDRIGSNYMTQES